MHGGVLDADLSQSGTLSRRRLDTQHSAASSEDDYGAQYGSVHRQSDYEWLHSGPVKPWLALSPVCRAGNVSTRSHREGSASHCASYRRAQDTGASEPFSLFSTSSHHRVRSPHKPCPPPSPFHRRVFLLHLAAATQLCFLTPLQPAEQTLLLPPPIQPQPLHPHRRVSQSRDFFLAII